MFSQMAATLGCLLELKHKQWRQRLRKRRQKSEVALHFIPSLSIYPQMLAIFLRSWILKDWLEVQGRRKKVFSCVHTFHTKRENRHFHVVIAQWGQKKNVQKKCDARAKLLLCQSKPVAFLPFSVTLPSSVLKLPNISQRWQASRKEESIISPNFSFRSFCSQTLCMLVTVCSCCCCCLQ